MCQDLELLHAYNVRSGRLVTTVLAPSATRAILTAIAQRALCGDPLPDLGYLIAAWRNRGPLTILPTVTIAKQHHFDRFLYPHEEGAA